MCCLIFALMILGPRLYLIGVAIFTTWIGRAYDTMLWPILGFFFMPWTCLAYMAAVLNNNGVSGLWIVLLIVAVLTDMGSWGNSRAQAQAQQEEE